MIAKVGQWVLLMESDAVRLRPVKVIFPFPIDIHFDGDIGPPRLRDNFSANRHHLSLALPFPIWGFFTHVSPRQNLSTVRPEPDKG